MKGTSVKDRIQVKRRFHPPSSIVGSKGRKSEGDLCFRLGSFLNFSGLPSVSFSLSAGRRAWQLKRAP